MTNNKILWSKSANIDLIEIVNYLKVKSKSSAKTALLDIKELVKDLYQYPEKGRFIPELERFNIKSYRELILSPWRIFYKIEGNIIKIVAVIDGRRNIEDILLKRNIR